MRRYYEVIGSAPVVFEELSVQPGVTTMAELEPAREAFLLRLGAIRIVDPHTEISAILPKDPRPDPTAAAAGRPGATDTAAVPAEE